MRPFAHAFLCLPVAAGLLLSACGSAEPSAGGASGPASRPAPASQPAVPMPRITPFGGPSALASAPKAVYMIHLHVGTVTVPTGRASGSEELWSYVDEEPVSLQSTVLGLNGLRVGIGRSDAWSDLAGSMKNLTGQTFKTTQLQVVAGQPTPVELKSRQPAQTIFVFFPDRTMTGMDYPPGDNLLTLSCTLNEDDPSKVLITALPQIRTTKRVPQFLQSAGVGQMVTRPLVYSFHPLTFQLTVDNDDFLIVGPGIMARRPMSLGHHFLLQDREGMLFETVLVIRPRVFRVEYGREGS